ncbi:ABC transporter substrate-binding protein [Halobacillus sp. Marseille-Q1614]|uniref:ABC transporter substrate-binding protein n=1 Tax=Halobacillus sp. Marseille-Q1614 TaxID=2709134 RepID=UPI0015703CFC|nr:ABC transporter substrate-binding protein [Halobacillus sp. Marseille-Q1614]
MKRNISFFLTALLLAVTFLAGCSSSGDSEGSDAGASGTVELDYWVPFSGGDGEYMAEMVDEFNSSQDGIKVNMLNIEWGEYYTKLRTSLASNTAPDVSIAHASKLAELVPTGSLTDLSEVAEAVDFDWSNISENQLEATVFDDQNFAVPLDSHALIMYYNKDYLAEAGLLDENENIKMEPGVDGFVSMLEELQASLPDGVFPFASQTDDVHPFWIWYALYSQMEDGGEYITDDQASFNNAAGEEALQVLADLTEKGLWPKNVTNGYDLFKTGKAAINFTGVWATGNYEQNEDLNFGASSLPEFFDQSQTWGDSHTLVLPTQDDQAKQEAAMEFVKWLSDNSVMWAGAGHVPANTEVVQSDEFKELEYRPSYADVAEDINYMPRTPQLWPSNDIMQKNFNSMMNGSMSVKEALDQAEKEVNNLLAN